RAATSSAVKPTFLPASKYFLIFFARKWTSGDSISPGLAPSMKKASKGTSRSTAWIFICRVPAVEGIPGAKVERRPLGEARKIGQGGSRPGFRAEQGTLRAETAPAARCGADAL